MVVLFKKSLFVLIIITCLKVDAQNITINVHKQPLNVVFVHLRNINGIQFSFNDNLLEQCIISDSAIYPSPELAVSALVKQCDFKYKIINNIFLIYKETNVLDSLNLRKNEIFLKGVILDYQNSESLPFASIQINKSGIISDVNGNFIYKTHENNLAVKVSHVGYKTLDTILNTSDKTHYISMVPQTVILNEIIVSAENNQSIIAPIGSKSGLVKLNHKITNFLPGNSDNTIFNLMRLQPGILAAGEQTKDFIIWGSYKGQSQVLFDGITLFNVSSENDHIGVLNPLIVKDIEILKGGYNAHIGDRVGGVVNISGKEGSFNRFGSTIKLSNETFSSIVNMPISKKSSLQIATRKTYYNIDNISSKSWLFPNNDNSDFIDLNVKYSGKSLSGNHYSISLIGSKDQFSQEKTDSTINNYYQNTIDLFNNQYGGSVFYGKLWRKIGITNFTLAYSEFKSSLYNSLIFDDKKDKSKSITRKIATQNTISEKSIKLDHNFPANKYQNISIGTSIIQNSSLYKLDSSAYNIKKHLVSNNRLVFYVKDNISIVRNLSLEPGIRVVYTPQALSFFIQPRINLAYNLSDKWKLTMACGKYNQLINENTLIDEYKNYLYYWSVYDGAKEDILTGKHLINGISYSYGKTNFSIEGFYKTTQNISRYTYDDSSETLVNNTNGQSNSFGVDFYFKRQILKHTFWFAYTLSKTEEYFSYFKNPTFQRSPHDQRHEIKCAGLFNFSPFYLSLDYVYGSGLPNTSNDYLLNVSDYSRFDIGAIYQFQIKNVKFESGLSIINVLNTKNIRYNNFSSFPDKKITYFPAIPFSPNILLNINF